jgi:hypothetical protein
MVLVLNPMPKHGYVMHKASFPTSKSSPIIPEDLPISLLLDIPASQHDYLHQKRLSKGKFSHRERPLNVLSQRPINLQIIQNSLAEIALKNRCILSSRALVG